MENQRGRPKGSLAKAYHWKIVVLDGDGDIKEIVKFHSVTEIMARFPYLTNPWTIYNLANGKYKLNTVGRITQEKLDFYKSIRIYNLEHNKDDAE